MIGVWSVSDFAIARGHQVAVAKAGKFEAHNHEWTRLGLLSEGGGQGRCEIRNHLVFMQEPDLPLSRMNVYVQTFGRNGETARERDIKVKLPTRMKSALYLR